MATAEALGPQVGVSVALVGSVAEAAELLSVMDPRPSLVVAGKSVAADPALVAAGAEPVGARSSTTISDLRRLVDEDMFRHDSSPALAAQVLGVRTLPGADGPRVRSVGRMDAVKAAVWAAEALRQRGGVPQIW